MAVRKKSKKKASRAIKVGSPSPAKKKAAEKPKLKRSTVSLKVETIDLARRLCRAWEDHSGRLPTIDEVISDGLSGLESAYKRKKIKIPKKAAAMRPGPKPSED